jgi:uncharacterized protein
MALVAGLLVLGGLIGVARAAAPEVDDEAGLFSEGARRRADQILADIYRETSPHKDVVVETHPELPRGLRPEQFSEERFRKRDVNGLLVLITKRPHKLLITVGRHTQDRFGASDAERMRGVMLERFKKSDFDGGLIEGLRYAERILKASYAPGRGVPAVEQRRVDPPSAPYREAPVHTRAAEKSGCSGASIFGVLLVVGLIWLIVGLIRGIWRAVSGGGSSPSAPSGGGYTGSYGGGYGGGYGAPGGGGGFGWGKAIAGGLFGAVAGNWVYDRFFRDDHHSSSSDYVGTAYADTGSSSSSYQAPSDEGQVGTTVGGGGGDDWGGSSSSDYSSGGSDWGGGGDSGGGGDWGGGGDSGGGGGDW